MFKDNTFIRHLVILNALFILWVGLTFLYILQFDTSLTVLSYNHGKNNFTHITYSKLLKGDKVSGTFQAAENNLGIVSVRFNTFIRPPYKNEDNLVFRIKEVGSHNWYYQNIYRVGLIYDVPLFPFGFPKISDSQGKIYYFEVESLKGNASNSVALSDRGQILFSRYQADKRVLLHDKKELMIFAFKKFSSAILTTDVKFSSFIYLLPLLFYLLWISPGLKLQKTWVTRIVSKQIVKKFHFVVLGVVLIDIFVIQLTNDIVYLVIPFLWIVVLRENRIGNSLTFLVALSMLLISPLFLFLKDPQTAEKGAAWAYTFLVAGIIQIVSELRKDKRKQEHSLLEE